jgi:hypothetical protein
MHDPEGATPMWRSKDGRKFHEVMCAASQGSSGVEILPFE